MFVVDLMHEFELGVWKDFFIHLVRILTSLGGDAILLCNQRYEFIASGAMYSL